MKQADRIRQEPLSDPPGEVAKRLGVSRQAVEQARKHNKPVGRPRKTVHPAEACARYIEHISYPFAPRQALLDLAGEIRAGAWKEYLK